MHIPASMELGCIGLGILACGQFKLCALEGWSGFFSHFYNIDLEIALNNTVIRGGGIIKWHIEIGDMLVNNMVWKSVRKAYREEKVNHFCGN